MKDVWPLRFRRVDHEQMLFTDDAGGWFLGSEAFLERYALNRLTEADHRFLRSNGHTVAPSGSLEHLSFLYRFAKRHTAKKTLTYIVLVPTLRCNLDCGYCQVSRAPQNAVQFDWQPSVTEGVIQFLDGLQTEHVKVEFQGGEPLLCIETLEHIRAFCRRRFVTSEFVVCTNLVSVGDREWAFLEAEDTYTSTSIDGPANIQTRNRTSNEATTSTFFANLERLIERVGHSRVSALPTIYPDAPPDFAELVVTYTSFGIQSIYLRPVNYHGFARRRGVATPSAESWNAFYNGFIDFLIARNAKSEEVVSEYYFNHCLKRVLQSGADGHVDLRNPNLAANDYIVIDHDGKLYPSDEARMLARIRHVDLSIGHVSTGMDNRRITQLNGSSLNDFDPDCVHCAFQPFCGTDTVDDLSRYGRVDLPRHATFFCQRQMGVFDKVFQTLLSTDRVTLRSLSAWTGIDMSLLDRPMVTS